MAIRLNDHDSHICISNVNETNLLDHLPPQVYTFRQIPMQGPILVKDRKRFEIADRKFGNHTAHHRQITQSFDRQGPTVGVLLEGIKGAGKSMLAEDLCNWAITAGMPVFRIDTEIDESDLRLMVSLARGNCAFYFDEFGKIYDEEARSKLLAFFGDSSMRGVMFLVTANSNSELSNFMLNRPGRFQFRIQFAGLDVHSAREVAAAFNLNQELTEAMARYAAYHFEISYDILIHLGRLARETTSLAELAGTMETMNIPGLVYNYYEITEIEYNGESYGKDRAQVKIADDKMHLTLLDADDRVLVDALVIDLCDAKARHLDTDIEYPDGLALGVHSLRWELGTDSHEAVRVKFKRTVAEKQDRMKLSLPENTKRPKKEVAVEEEA